MIPVSTAEKILDEKTFFVSTFLDKYKVLIKTFEKCSPNLLKSAQQIP